VICGLEVTQFGEGTTARTCSRTSTVRWSLRPVEAFVRATDEEALRRDCREAIARAREGREIRSAALEIGYRRT
jgi:hypothetical protein